jgi:hypothetical protein
MARIASFEHPVMIFSTVRPDSSKGNLPRNASFEHPVMIFSPVRSESSEGSLPRIASFEHPVCMVFSAVVSRRVSECSNFQ